MPTKTQKVAGTRPSSSVKSKSTAKAKTTTASRKAPAKSQKATKAKTTVAKAKGASSVAKIKKTASVKAKPPTTSKKEVLKGSTKKAIPSKKAQPKVQAKPAKDVKAVSKSTKAKANTKKALELPEKLRDAALKVLDERKAEDIVCIDLRGRSSLADYAMIASGTSARQLGAIANYLLEAFAKLGVKGVRVEGLPQGDWVLIDAGDILIHMFRPEVRTYYQIEDIWSETTG